VSFGFLPVKTLLFKELFSLAMYSLLRLTERLSKLRQSSVSLFLILKSSYASVANEGEWFTSINHGFKKLSKNISNPSI
jgi:hypothetical protein